MSVRIVICVDLVPDNLAGAYYDLYTLMAKSGLDWESSDEWYGADGQLIDETAAQAARMEVYGKLHPDVINSLVARCPDCRTGSTEELIGTVCSECHRGIIREVKL